MKTSVSKLPDSKAIPEHSWQVRVYYEDTDAAGVVYHSNYLKYMERARTEWLREAGFSQPVLARDMGVVFVVATMNIAFRAPAHFDDQLNIHSRIIQAGGSKFLFEQTITNPTGDLICTAEINIVCVDPSTFRPKRIPEQIRAKLSYDD